MFVARHTYNLYASLLLPSHVFAPVVVKWMECEKGGGNKPETACKECLVSEPALSLAFSHLRDVEQNWQLACSSPLLVYLLI